MKRPYYLTPTRPLKRSRSPQRTFAVLCVLLLATAFWNYFRVVRPEMEEKARHEARTRSIRYILDPSPAVVQKTSDPITF